MLQLQAFAIVLVVVAAGNADAQHNVRGISSCEVVTVTPPETRLMRGDETLVRLPRVDEPLFDRRPISSEVRRRRPTPPEIRLRPGSRRW